MDERNCTRLATRADATAIGALRLEAYKSSPDFRVTNAQFIERLKWTDEDDAATVLAVWHKGQPIATSRIQWIHDRHHLSTFSSGVIPPPDHVEWPALATARGATHASHSRRGLNSLLRYYFLDAALGCRVRRMYGYVVVGAARTKLLTALGYEFTPRSGQDPDLASQRPWVLTSIDLHERGQQAISLLDGMLSALKQEYPWVGPSLRVSPYHA